MKYEQTHKLAAVFSAVLGVACAVPKEEERPQKNPVVNPRPALPDVVPGKEPKKAFKTVKHDITIPAPGVGEMREEMSAASWAAPRAKENTPVGFVLDKGDDMLYLPDMTMAEVCAGKPLRGALCKSITRGKDVKECQPITAKTPATDTKTAEELRWRLCPGLPRS